MWKYRSARVTLACLACGSLICGMAGVAKAQGPTSPLPALPLASRTSADARQQLAETGGEPSSTGWRYRKFNGQWWYFLPNQQWARWDGGRWTIPAPKASDYQEWRHQQFAGRYSDSAAQDAEMRRRDVDRWRGRATKSYANAQTQGDAEYHAQVDKMHDYLMITPYDYRIGTQGHGLFEANPDRTIANSGRFNYANSMGGYMGGALRSPYGY